jgi:hypothetical protein
MTPDEALDVFFDACGGASVQWDAHVAEELGRIREQSPALADAVKNGSISWPSDEEELGCLWTLVDLPPSELDAAIAKAKLLATKSRPVKKSSRRRGEGKRTLSLRAAILNVLQRIEGSLSSRQVFYQCVSMGTVANNKPECLRVGRLLVKMRRDGSVPYSRIVDRTRAKHVAPSWEGVRSILNATARQYRSSFWNDQPMVPMIACEKQALEGIFEEAVDQYGVPLFVVRGFNSESFEYEWSEDIKRYTDRGQSVVIYYFGDHDPSGLCIEANSQRKLEGFGARFAWVRAGLLWEDFERYDLVNIPVKHTDTRAKSYLSKFGDRAAELDALHPDELRGRIHDCIERHVDADAWDAVQRADEAERESLNLVAENWAQALAAVGGAA